MKFLIGAVALMMCTNSYGQIASADVSMSEETNTETEVKPAAPAPIAKKEVAIHLRNNCERSIAIYSGDKKQVFSGKGQSLGGLSNNQFFLYEGDVVCIMNDPKTIQACTIIKEGMANVAINPSGNGFLK